MRRSTNPALAPMHRFDRRAGCLAALLLIALGTAPPATAQPYFADVTQAKNLGNFRAIAGDGHGPGGVFTDLTGDGYPELYLITAQMSPSQPGANELYLNVPDGFGGRTYQQLLNHGAEVSLRSNGAVAGDYDNDGDLDLYVINMNQPNVLLQSQWAQTGALGFVDVTASTDPTPSNPPGDTQHGLAISFEQTAQFGPVALDNSLSAAWSDVDRDGDLDLYVGNHNWWCGGNPQFREGPFSKPGRPDVFYMNNGDGTFQDMTFTMNIYGYDDGSGGFETSQQRYSSTNAVIFADFNNDRWPDLLVSNKAECSSDRDLLYINQGMNAAGVWLGFSVETYNLGFGNMTSGAMGVDVGDPDNDGDLDIYLTDTSSGSIGRNDLWINTWNGTSLGFVHNDTVFPALWSWGTQWADIDNDGFQDLHVATQIGLPDFLYWNQPPSYPDVAGPVGVAQVKNARGDMSADYDKDGWIDFFVVNDRDGASVLYENRLDSLLPNHHHLTIELIGSSQSGQRLRSSRDALGARVEVTADLNGNGSIEPAERQIREVLSGSSNAASTSSLALELGLRFATTANVVVRWPSGRSTRHNNVAADQCLTITEPLDDTQILPTHP